MTRTWQGFDFDGTIVSEAVAREAGKRWFSYFAERLDDPGIAKLGKQNSFLDEVIAVMTRLCGKEANTPELRATYLNEARDYYQTLYLEIVANHGDRSTNEQLIRTIRKLKKMGERIALISTSPTPIVERSLILLGIHDLFDVMLASPQDVFTKKQALLEEFQQRHGPLSHYTGNSEEDEAACKALGIAFTRVEPF